ncbi:MAG: enoyl-CoA hydratase/isomerase family protein [Ilumatobacteraceae bacterium]
MSVGVALSCDVTDGVGRVTFTRPERSDPIDSSFCHELREIVDALAGDPTLKVVVIRSTGRFFSVGGDVKALGADRAALRAYVRAATADVGTAMSRLARLPAPVVVEVRGSAAGGALALIAVADVAIASTSATFYGAFVGIGLSPDLGSTYFVSRRVGGRQAANLFVLNQTWTAGEALARGLVSQVAADDEIEAITDSTVAELAAGPTAALAATKRLLWQSWYHSLETQLEHEAASITALAATDDAWEGLAAVNARRRPDFHGR